MAAKPSIGGQALIEGVMMRGPRVWALAVRKPDGEILTEAHPLPGHAERHRWLRWPLVRGVYVLGESLAVGVKALMISANHSLPEEERLSGKQLGWTMGGAMIFFLALFIAMPALATKFGGRRIGVESEVVQNLVEGAIRIGMFVGYILLISLFRDIKRVFQYHGAEHKTIYAYENEDPMQPEVIDRYSTLHVRCGTNFLFIVLSVTIIAHLILDLLLPQSIPLRVGARILALPVLAGFGYEVIKGASRKGDSRMFRVVSLPGLALQKITTRVPTHDQIEVAIAAMQQVIAREGLAEAPAEQSHPETGPPSPAPA